MPYAPADRLRALLGDKIPEGGTEADCYFTDAELQNMLDETDSNINRAAYEGWRQKAAYYADLVTVTEGNALRQMSDLYTHAMGMVKHFQSAGPVLSSGRTRVGRIVRGWN